LLLCIPGGSGDGGPFGALADRLSDRFTVAIYDRRGYGRSPLGAPPDDTARLQVDAADAARLIAHLAPGPADVLGSSSGAIVGLELLVRRPGQVRTLVAHEPPLVTLLPDADAHLVFLDGIYDLYRDVGADAAMERFAAGIGLGAGAPGPPPPPEWARTVARIRASQPFFLEHELRQYPRTEPDIAALRALADRIVLAGGRESGHLLPYWPNTVLAARLGLAVTDFPGGHLGPLSHATEFAQMLLGVLEARVGQTSPR